MHATTWMNLKNITLALFTIAKTWKQPKCPFRLTDEWVNKRWYVYTMEY